MIPSNTFNETRELINKRFRPERGFSESWNTRRRYRLA
ncbi:hypothetical protein NMS_2679 [Nonlabens marinus S1-08]|uniref:Uncharacterized protein n=1 Tax=Nonlabens marinus S1-08 TaxID=1454201 RepID=W8VWX2_9FLAO|nr:hypothetical protein NMS_2679 [Nonlabens marinus S1-08]